MSSMLKILSSKRKANKHITTWLKIGENVRSREGLESNPLETQNHSSSRLNLTLKRRRRELKREPNKGNKGPK
jgi:hypothetical protein